MSAPKFKVGDVIRHINNPKPTEHTSDGDIRYYFWVDMPRSEFRRLAWHEYNKFIVNGIHMSQFGNELLYTFSLLLPDGSIAQGFYNRENEFEVVDE